MALTGTLSDLGLIDLVQVPSVAGKTGELIIAGQDNEARLYYRQGQLYHAVCGEKPGLEALVELMFFAEGEFEFRNGVAAEDESISGSLKDLLEKAQAEHRKRGASPPQRSRLSVAPENTISSLSAAISESAKRHQYIEHVALYSRSGKPLCKWDRERPDALFDAAILQVIALLENHPRDGLNKLYFTDTQGTIVATLINEKTILLMNADTVSSLGMISLASSKLVQTIQEVL
ncbi:MAG: DUF4388 domain-containing protein [Deltaproteobacteria bacterium]|nr:DUF4388 domain-containing protein [Deltaproteobacteria bacterium]